MIANLIRTNILPALAQTGHFAVLTGIVNQVTLKDYDEGGREYRHTFPIACGVSGKALNEAADYQRLVPDSSKMSLGFFENQAFRITGGRQPRTNMVEGTVRFLSWFNLELMGAAEYCDTPFKVIEDARNALSGQFDDAPFNGAAAITSVTAIQDRSPQAAFGRYSFAANEAIFLYPYSFAAFEVAFKIEYFPECVPTVGTTGCECLIL